MSKYKIVSEKWDEVHFYDGKTIFGREEFGGVYRTAVEGFRGGEEVATGPNAKKEAIGLAMLRIDDMNNTE